MVVPCIFDHLSVILFIHNCREVTRDILVARGFFSFFFLIYLHFYFQLIDEFTDVNDGEKELMKLWNLHLMKNRLVFVLSVW